ncbi:hypothetical protein KY347_01475 [Candidatus Woesearchaeota archaeon]|nr:hypothetical protein [Candidatus Woesearchaeota archaeon]
MFKKIVAALLITLMLFIFLGCAKKTGPETIAETPTAEVSEPVGEIETGIAGISDIEEDMDASELDDLDTILGDIENI